MIGRPISIACQKPEDQNIGYIDGYLIPVTAANKGTDRALATKSAALFVGAD
jgi:hypothetical protein